MKVSVRMRATSMPVVAAPSASIDAAVRERPSVVRRKNSRNAHHHDHRNRDQPQGVLADDDVEDDEHTIAAERRQQIAVPADEEQNRGGDRPLQPDGHQDELVLGRLLADHRTHERELDQGPDRRSGQEAGDDRDPVGLLRGRQKEHGGHRSDHAELPVHHVDDATAAKITARPMPTRA